PARPAAGRVTGYAGPARRARSGREARGDGRRGALCRGRRRVRILDKERPSGKQKGRTSFRADWAEGGHMRHRGEAISESTSRHQLFTSVLQNRAFIELSRILASGDSALLSSALPVIVRGAAVPAAAVFTEVEGELSLTAAEAVKLSLRAYLEEP